MPFWRGNNFSLHIKGMRNLLLLPMRDQAHSFSRSFSQGGQCKVVLTLQAPAIIHLQKRKKQCHFHWFITKMVLSHLHYIGGFVMFSLFSQSGSGNSCIAFILQTKYSQNIKSLFSEKINKIVKFLKHQIF